MICTRGLGKMNDVDKTVTACYVDLHDLLRYNVYTVGMCKQIQLLQ